jgi:hypothetical protein
MVGYQIKVRQNQENHEIYCRKNEESDEGNCNDDEERVKLRSSVSDVKVLAECQQIKIISGCYL